MFYKLLFVQNGVSFDPQKKDKIICKEIKRQAPVYEVSYADFEGVNGSREVSASFRPFDLSLTFDIFYRNEYEKTLMVTELQQMIFVGYQYYIIHELEPGKRFKINPTNFEFLEEENDYSTIEITFTVVDGYSEAVSTTLSNFDLLDEWQFSQNLESLDYEYSFEKSRFSIFNAGDFVIDPRNTDMKILIEGESEGNLTVFNRTTGDRFVYYPALSTARGQTLTIEGVYPKLNGVARGIDTNHGLITLSEGINEIEIQNITRVKSSWDFRFLYK